MNVCVTDILLSLSQTDLVNKGFFSPLSLNTLGGSHKSSVQTFVCREESMYMESQLSH